MAETKTIELLVPFEHHNETIRQVAIREPSGGLYAKHGDPRIAVRTKDGGYWVEQPEVIKAYLDRLIVHQDGGALLGLMALPDVMQLKEELFGFFSAAEGTIIARRAAASSTP